ncbi:MAG: hypothetical protein HQM12_04505 [SAR324 cluster bacterium]|nr:hypothetical protein [SAR324 cluster bacterium]MBF0352375.1 hypothetical protein [SAR324 cluster bacterium]
MEVVSVSEARKQLFGLVREHKPVEITHKTGNMILLPKEEYQKMEMALLDAEIERIKKTQHRVPAAEVEQRIAEALSG